MSIERIRSLPPTAWNAAPPSAACRPHTGSGCSPTRSPNVYDANYLPRRGSRARRGDARRGDGRADGALPPPPRDRSSRATTRRRRRSAARLDTCARPTSCSRMRGSRTGASTPSMVREVEFDELVPAAQRRRRSPSHGATETSPRSCNDAKRLIMRRRPDPLLRRDRRRARRRVLRAAQRRARSPDRGCRRAARSTAAAGSAAPSCSTRSTRHAATTTSSSSRRSPTTGRAELYAKLGFDVVDRRDFPDAVPASADPPARCARRGSSCGSPPSPSCAQLYAGRRRPASTTRSSCRSRSPGPTTSNEPELPRLPPATRSRRSAPDELASSSSGGVPRRPPDRRAGGRGEGVRRRPDGRRPAPGSAGRWQGHGLGTEMRAAVLTLAFAGSAPSAPRSGAIAGQPTVARRLSQARLRAHRASHTVSPRGKPVTHDDLELARERFSSPGARSRVDGLDGLLQLFGA